MPYASVYGGMPHLLMIRRGPIDGTWRAYLGAYTVPPQAELRRAVRAAGLEYLINWKSGPFFDGRGRVYYDAVRRPGSTEIVFGRTCAGRRDRSL